MTRLIQTFIPTIGCLLLIILGLATQSFVPFLSIIFYLGAISFGGFKQTREGLTELWQENTLNVDLLMALAAIGACLIGDFLEGAMLTFIFCLSGALEEYTTSKSQQEITALMNLQPRKAQRLTANEELEEIAVTDLKINDRVFVPKGGTIPIDGYLESQQATVDEATLSGESVPVEKVPHDELFAGTINRGNPLILQVTKKSDETVFAKIIQLVEKAQSTPTKTASFISRIENTYVKGVLVVVPLMILVSYFIFGWSFQESFYRGMVLLVVASPCALIASATPATLAALSNAARNGVLIKGGLHLEQLADLKAIAFDKTGTLTQGVFEVNGIHHNEMEKEKLIEYAALAESASSHPISKSLQRAYGKQIDRSRVTDIQEISGNGVIAKVDGVEVAAGNDKLMKHIHVKPLNCHQVGTIIHLAINGKYAGHIVISDIVKPHSKEAIAALKRAGIEKTVMLTGDAKKVAEQVAASLGIDQVYSELLPADKVAKVEELLKIKGAKDKLAFVGDGINDAPVLSRADIGIAMGAMGSDAAIEAADVVLMDDDPMKIATAIKISRKCLKIVYQNISVAIGVKLICLILGAVGIANMWLAIFADVGVMILAVLNAIRALFVKKM